jgi:hypothetical protein
MAKCRGIGILPCVGWARCSAGALRPWVKIRFCLLSCMVRNVFVFKSILQYSIIPNRQDGGFPCVKTDNSYYICKCYHQYLCGLSTIYLQIAITQCQLTIATQQEIVRNQYIHYTISVFFPNIPIFIIHALSEGDRGRILIGMENKNVHFPIKTGKQALLKNKQYNK